MFVLPQIFTGKYRKIHILCRVLSTGPNQYLKQFFYMIGYQDKIHVLFTPIYSFI